MDTLTAPDAQSSPERPGGQCFCERTARALLMGCFVFLVIVQGVYIGWLGNGLGPVSDGFDEANAIRSAEAFNKEGFTKHFGLARPNYGNRFPGAGGMAMRAVNGKLMPRGYEGTPADYAEATYIHYPTGAEFFCGVLGAIFGLEHLWLLRLVPALMALAALVFFLKTLIRNYGIQVAAVVACGLVTLPAFQCYFPGLSFESYSFSLLLLELSLLINLFRGAPRPRTLVFAVLFLLGFLQGWLTFDQCFVVTFAAVPLWFMERAAERRPSFKTLFFVVFLSGAGFTAAHLLHFYQVALELGSFKLAAQEFTQTAAARSGDEGQMTLPDLLKSPKLAFLHLSDPHPTYSQSLIAASYSYFRSFVHPLALQFSPQLPLLILVLSWMLLKRGIDLPFAACRLAWPGRGSLVPALLAGVAVSSTWLFVMPAHTQGNHHFVVRHFLLFYLVALLILARSLSARPAQAVTGSVEPSS